jgi:predicted metal-dependent phosphoesterase TrpH
MAGARQWRCSVTPPRCAHRILAVLKVELHTHTSDDPQDRIAHSTLIDRAATLKFDALAITLHDRQLDLAPFASYAAERGVTLIPGIERTVEGRHVLLLNFPRGADEVRSFDDVRRLKRQCPGLVVAPHPFFPSRLCLLGCMNRHADLFDAVEYNAMFTASLNFNVRAERWARQHGLPMVGNGDVHLLEQLGTTYSLVDAERDPASICAAIAAAHVRVVSQPLSWPTAVSRITRLVASSHGWILPSPEPARASM